MPGSAGQRHMAETLREALGPSAGVASPLALGLRLGLGLRRKVVPASRHVLDLRPPASNLVSKTPV